jgi:hypothetical protein
MVSQPQRNKKLLSKLARRARTSKCWLRAQVKKKMMMNERIAPNVMSKRWLFSWDNLRSIWTRRSSQKEIRSSILKDRRRWPEGGWMRANKNSSPELGSYPKMNLTYLSSNSVKTI